MRTEPVACATRRIVPFVVALAFAASAAVVAGQPKDMPLTNARWDLPTGSAGLNVQVAADQKTRTDCLPPVTQITSNRWATVQLQYGAGQTYGQGAVELVSPGGAQVTCNSMSTIPVLFSCVANMTWLRTLTADTTVRLRAKSMNNQVHYLDWTFIAPPNLVFLAEITGPASVLKGNVAEFTLRLEAPAPQAGVTVRYQAEPAVCFAVGASRVNNSSGTLQFSQNQQYRTLTLTTAGCDPGNALIKTWTHEQRDQAPYYKTKSVTLVQPRP